MDCALPYTGWAWARPRSDLLVSRVTVTLPVTATMLKLSTPKSLGGNHPSSLSVPIKIGKLNHLPKILLGISAWSGIGYLDLIYFSLLLAVVITIAYRKIKVFSGSQVSAMRITAPFSTQDSNYLCYQWTEKKNPQITQNKSNPNLTLAQPPKSQKNKHKASFLCVTQISYLHFRAMLRAAQLVLSVALWAVLNFTEEGDGKGRESGKN